jgi:hypothetical protein
VITPIAFRKRARRKCGGRGLPGSCVLASFPCAIIMLRARGVGDRVAEA